MTKDTLSWVPLMSKVRSLLALVGYTRLCWLLLASLGVGGILWGAHRLTEPDRKKLVPSATATPALDRAVDFVNSEAESWGAHHGLAPEYLHALSAMNYIQATVSGSRHTFLRKKQQLPATLDAETCLSLHLGQCGNQMDAFDKILRRCRVATKRRSAEFYLHDEKNDNNGSHVVAEVYYKGGWHLFDITAGTVFLRRGAKSQDDLLSAEEIRALIKGGQPWRDLAIANNASVARRQLAWDNTDANAYLDWPDADLVLGRTGTIHLRADSSGKKYCLQHVPTAIGHCEDYCGNLGKLDFRLDAQPLRRAEQKVLEIAFNGVAYFNDGARLVVKESGRVLKEIPLDQLGTDRILEVKVDGVKEDLRLELHSKDSKGFLSVQRIAVR